MARVPTTQARSVQVQALDTRPLRYARTRNYVGEAVSDFGASMQRGAEDWDRIEAVYDQADSLNLYNTLAGEARATIQEFKDLRGDQPGRELQGYLSALQDRAEQLVGAARSERSQALTKRAISARMAEVQERLTAHADDEMFKFRDAALAAGAQQAAMDAIGAAGTPQFAVQIGVGLTRIEERALLNGAPDEVVELERSKFYDEVHGGVIDTMFAVPDPDIDGIMGYVETYGGDMTPALRNETLARLQKPLQGRVARSDADLVLGLAPPENGLAPAGGLAIPPGTPQGEVGGELAKAGYSNAVIAGFLGNFDVEGGYDGARGDGGTASGIAQWRHERRDNFRRKFGKEPHEATAAEQAQFVVWEMENPGKAGMTVAQRDAILEAESPAEAAALIDQHYERSSGQHRARRQEAAEGYGGAYAPAPREWDRTQVYASLEATAEREQWNPERTERARDELDSRITRDEKLLSEQQSDADEQAAAIVQSLGDGFTSINMIPRETWNRLSPTDKMAWERAAKANSTPEAVDANGQTAVALSVMRIRDPDKFAGLNLTKYQHALTPGEFEQFAKDQATISSKAGKPFDDRPKIDSTISRMKKWGGVEIKDGPEGLAVRRYMEVQADEFRSQNKVPTQQDYDRWFAEATHPVNVQRAMFNMDILWPDEERRSNEFLSPNYRAVIRREFRQVFGREPDEAEIVKWWERMTEGAQ